MELIDQWKVQDSLDIYEVKHWGKGYFGINEKGHVTVHPERAPNRPSTSRSSSINCRIAASSCRSCCASPTSCAIASAKFTRPSRPPSTSTTTRATTAASIPIKVNQQRHVVEEILDFGKPFNFGLEAGSKPELLAVLALTNGGETPIICNGFKDDEFIKMTILARKMGKHIIPVVEKFTELELIVRYAEELNVRPVIGIRVKLAARGAGRWRNQRGLPLQVRPDPDRGARSVRVPQAARHGGLPAARPLPPRQPDHQHPQHQERPHRGRPRLLSSCTASAPACKYLDVGGGLGIDYDGSQTDFESSVNYTLQEYANDVVFRIKSVCDECGVPHPTIISESGRAVVAYHSMLVFDVLGVSNFDRYTVPPEIPADAPQQVSDLFGIYRDLSKKNMLEGYHDAVQAMDDSLNMFNLGAITIEHAGPDRTPVLGGLRQDPAA